MLLIHFGDESGNPNTARQDLACLRRFGATFAHRRRRRPRTSADGSTHGKGRARRKGRAHSETRCACLDLRCGVQAARGDTRLGGCEDHPEHLRCSGRDIGCICLRPFYRTSVLDARLPGPSSSFSTSRWTWRASKIGRRKEEDHAKWRQNRTFGNGTDDGTRGRLLRGIPATGFCESRLRARLRWTR